MIEFSPCTIPNLVVLRTTEFVIPVTVVTADEVVVGMAKRFVRRGSFPIHVIISNATVAIPIHENTFMANFLSLSNMIFLSAGSTGLLNCSPPPYMAKNKKSLNFVDEINHPTYRYFITVVPLCQAI